MNNKVIEAEKKVFLISVIGTITFSIFGFIIFLISKSQSVLLDSLFSLIVGLVTLISIWVVSISSKNPSENYPYGLIQARPMLELFKSILILSLTVYAVFNAIYKIISGGTYIFGKIIVIYSIISVIFSVIIIASFYFLGRKANSSLIKLEIIQWKQDTLISLSIGIIFAITIFIKHPYIDFISPYLDSILAIIIGISFVPSIVKIIISSGKQLLLASPPAKIKEKISEQVVIICKKYNLDIRNKYFISTGGLLFVDIEVYIKEKLWNWKMVNAIRKNATMNIKSICPDSEVFVSFYNIEDEETLKNIE